MLGSFLINCMSTAVNITAKDFLKEKTKLTSRINLAR